MKPTVNDIICKVLHSGKLQPYTKILGNADKALQEQTLQLGSLLLSEEKSFLQLAPEHNFINIFCP
jgi:hypothetical protein